MIVFYLIFFLLMVGYCLLIEYYHRAWTRIPAIQPKETPLTTKVSVVIALRDEEKNVAGLIQSLKAQDYPRGLVEIILVNDHSTDDTQDLLLAHAEDGYIHAVKLVDAPQLLTGNNGAYKKMAIRKGIELAKGELIITTDADCRFNTNWITTMVNCYEQTGAKFIAAPVKLTGPAGFLSIFQKLDFMSLQGITGASVFKRFHCMCNGANLAYSRSAFHEVKGFDGIDHIPSGDDMLLMYKIFRQDPTKVVYLKAEAAIVNTDMAATWKEFFNQRIRWASKASHYDDRNVFRVLLMVYLVNICFMIAAVASFWKLNYFIFFVLMIVVKLLVEFPFVSNVSGFFGEKKLMKYFPLLEPFHVLYTVVSGWLGKFGSYEWKGRKINNHAKRF